VGSLLLVDHQAHGMRGGERGLHRNKMSTESSIQNFNHKHGGNLFGQLAARQLEKYNKVNVAAQISQEEGVLSVGDA
jgi:hypothetical protein